MTKTRVDGSGGGPDDGDTRKQAAALGMVTQAVSPDGISPPPGDVSFHLA